MKYLCLGYYEPAKHAAMTEDERNAMFDECFEYDDYLRANGHSAGGEALQPPETALTLYWRNGKVATTDGPYVETKEQLGGIGVLEARDMNHAIQLLSQHPVLKYGALFEIRPTVNIQKGEQLIGTADRGTSLWPSLTCSSWWSTTLDRWQVTDAKKKAEQYLQ